MGKNHEDKDLGQFNFTLGAVKPTARRHDVVEVVIDPDQVLGNFVDAFIDEATRKNPLTFDRVNLTSDELKDYVRFLIQRRIRCVQRKCTDWRELKVLWIPAYVQYCLRLVGRVMLYEEGLDLVPVVDNDEVISLREAIEISERIAAFQNDLQMVQDAMPRDPNGNVDVMSTALIAGYVCSRKEVHLAATYVCAFMGMKLRQEVAFQSLYRLRYDDLSYIAVALTTQKVI